MFSISKNILKEKLNIELSINTRHLKAISDREDLVLSVKKSE